jgi:hypothetical protein
MRRVYLKFRVVVIILCVCGLHYLNAQVDVTVNGLGRAILTNNKMTGNIMKSDTVSARKGLSGYNLFDLGFNLEKGREFQSNVILRVRQPWGDFWGEQTRFEFRQLQIKGDLNWLSYEIGDIDVQNTAYTVYNQDEIYNQYEAPVFRARRDIVQYENFNKDNVWRLQGVKLGTEWYLGKKNLESFRLNTFGVRTNITNEFSIPDRLLIGGRLDIHTTDKYTIGVNYVGLQDVPLDDFATNYVNHVVTGSVDLWTIRKENFKFGITGESGSSGNNYYKLSTDTTYKSNDFFVDGGVKSEFKKKIFVKVSYKNVGVKYSSPSAQTTRVNVNTAPLLFSKVLNGTVNRSQLLYDRFTQEQIYNRGISPVLQLCNPIYNNVMPYGEATPNRTGYSFEVGKKESEKLEFNVQARLLSEIVGEGTAAKRNFIASQGGVKLGIGAISNIERKIDLYLGGRYEKTSRSGGGVDLTSTLMDAGMVFQLFKQVDILGGAKILNASGDEIIPVRDDLNYIYDYVPVHFDVQESVWSYGIRINFNETTNFNVNHQIVENLNKNNSDLNYNISQLFMNFNIMF